MAVRLAAFVDHGRQLLVFLGVGGMIDIEVDMKIAEVAVMFYLHAGNEFLGRDAEFFSTEHDARAMGIIGADVMTLVSPHALETYPYVSLDITQQVAEMDGPIGIGQGIGNKDAAFVHRYFTGLVSANTDEKSSAHDTRIDPQREVSPHCHSRWAGVLRLRKEQASGCDRRHNFSVAIQCAGYGFCELLQPEWLAEETCNLQFIETVRERFITEPGGNDDFHAGVYLP